METSRKDAESGRNKSGTWWKKLGVWPNIMWKWTEKCGIEQKKWDIGEKRNEEHKRKIDESGRNNVETMGQDYAGGRSCRSSLYPCYTSCCSPPTLGGG